MATTKAIELAEEVFAKYLMGDSSITELEEGLSVALNNLPLEPAREFVVNVKLENRVSNRFFGIECYPTITCMQQMAQSLFDQGIIEDREYDLDTVTPDLTRSAMFLKTYRSTTSWCIMIDLLCLDRDFIAFNPKELTAMLLHEVGYTIASDIPATAFYTAYLNGLSRMPAARRVHTASLYGMYTIPMAIACTPRLWFETEDQIKLDAMADQTLIECGYEEHLISAVKKIVKAIGTETFEPQNYNDLDASIDWVNKNIVDVVRRRDMLRDELYYIAIRRNDGYIPHLCDDILRNMGASLRERYSGAVMESYGTGVTRLADGTISLEDYAPFTNMKTYSKLEAAYTAANESFLNRKTKKRSTLPSQYDIDRIMVEIDKIQNQYDRIYVLDLIYECVQRIDMFEESLMDNSNELRRWAPRITQMRNDLDKCRQMVLDKKNFDKSYKLWVKVPEEYEG